LENVPADPLSGTFRLVSEGPNLVLKDIDVKIAAAGVYDLTAAGEYILYKAKKGTARDDVIIRGALEAPCLESLGEKFGVDMPDLGAIKSRFLLKGAPGRFSLNDILVETESEKGFKISADGSAGHVFAEDSKLFENLVMQASGSAPGLLSIPGLVDLPLPEIGPLTFKATVKGDAHNIKLSGGKIESEKMGVFSAELEGDVRTDSGEPESEWDFALVAEDPKIFADALGFEASSMPPVESTGTARITNKAVKVSCGLKLSRSVIDTKFETDFAGKVKRFKMDIASAALYLEDIGLSAKKSAPIPSAKGPRKYIFDETDLNIELIRSAEGAATVDITEVRGQDFIIRGPYAS
jgi:hypothetical protein